jgi:hypothetical protein
MLVTYLALIPSVLYVVVSQSLLTLGIFSIQLILVLVGTWVMYRKFVEERLVDLIDFTKKLDIFVKELKDKLIDPACNYSLPCIALEIARNKKVFRDTQAWDKLLTKLSEDLTNNTSTLDKRIEADGKQFRINLNGFRQILVSMQEFKKRFYEMISEASYLGVYYNNPEFKKIYERSSEEYNRYVDKLKIFSDDIKVKFEESLDEKLTERVKGYDELFPSFSAYY